MSARERQRPAPAVLTGFILANVAVMVVVLVGTVAPQFSLGLVLPPWYPPWLILLASGFAAVAALIARSATRASGVDLVLLIMTGVNLVAVVLGLAGPMAPTPAEHVEATLAGVAICVLLLAAILLGRAQRPASGEQG
jgi:hypothetical protein